MRNIKILFILFVSFTFHVEVLKSQDQCDCEENTNKIYKKDSLDNKKKKINKDSEANVIQKDKIIRCLPQNSEASKLVNEAFKIPFKKDINIFRDSIINKYCAKICENDNTAVLALLRKELDSKIDKTKFQNFSAVRASLICMAVKRKNQTVAPKNDSTPPAKEDTLLKKSDLSKLLDDKNDLDQNNTILLSLLVLIIVGIMAFLIYSETKKKKGKNNIHSQSSNTDQSINNEPQKINIDKHEEILANIKRAHKSEIEVLQSKIEALQKSNIGDTEKKDSAMAIMSNYQASTSKPSKLYVSIPTGKAFYRSYESLVQQDTYFVIEYEFGSKEGKITLVDDPLTLAHAYSMVDSLRGVCELKGTGRPSTNIKVNVTPGRVEKTTDAWVLTQPIILEWKS
jgi:hypothetical protein